MIQSLKGMPDILPTESAKWRFVEEKMRLIMDAYAYEEIRTPILEDTSLFVRSVGEHTDIVGKEMFTFVDQGGVSMSLRPEGTASVMRSYIQHNLQQQNAFSKLYYLGPMYRHERPQKGRLRQFHQLGAEAIGLKDAGVDVEMIALLMNICRTFELPDIQLELNTLGDAETRTKYKEVIQNYFRKYSNELADAEKIRLEKNPLRLLDSKNPKLEQVITEAPSILNFLTSDSKNYFDQVQQGLSDANILFHINPRIVRGLDYYSHTAFEVLVSGLGSQNTVGAGGRYDKLSTDLGEKEIPAIGFAMGIERLLLCLGEKLDVPTKKRVELISLDDKAKQHAFRISENLRKDLKGRVHVHMQFEIKSLKAAMRLADKNKATWVLILGENELKNQKAVVKDLTNSEQVEVPFGSISTYIKDKVS